MHQPEQLSLFSFEADNTALITSPRPWSKTYRSWRGDFQVLGHRYIGKSKVTNYDFYVEVYDPDGSWETVLEITSHLTTVAESMFRDIVDRLESTGNLLPIGTVIKPPLFVSESNLIDDSQIVTDVPTDTNDSLTFSLPSVSESLVSDVSPKHEVSESLSKNDSLTGVNVYEAGGSARGGRKYFRYSYREGERIKHLHIGGGNVHCSVAVGRAQLVRDALLARQLSPQEIKLLIRGLRS